MDINKICYSALITYIIIIIITIVLTVTVIDNFTLIWGCFFLGFFLLCIFQYCKHFFPQTQQNPVEMDIQPDDDNIIIQKVLNISETELNFNDICPICLDNIDPIDSYKLNICNCHIYHKICIEIYLNNNFTICPLCNV